MNFLRSLPKDKLQKVLLVGIVALVALAVVINFYIIGKISSISKNKERIAELKRQIDDAEREAKLEEQNQKLHQQVATFTQSQNTTMVSGDPFSWVVRQVTLLAENRPVRVVSMRPGAKTQNQQKSRGDIYTASIEVEGGYDQIGQFMRDFENTFSTSQIRSVELTPGSANDRRALVQIAFLVQSDSNLEKPAASKATEKKKAS